MRRVDLEIDGLPVDALVVSSYPRCLRLDFTLDVGKVVEPPPWVVEELSPFLLSCYARGCMRDVDFVVVWDVFAVARKVDELQNERSPRYDTASSGQKVSSDNVLENR